MEISTTRFGVVTVAARDAIYFPAGLPGLEECRHWVLLADPQDGSVAWLQSTEWPEVAFAVVSPRHYAPDYVLRANGSELASLGLVDLGDAQVLVIVGQDEQGLTLNLKAPVVIDMRRRLGGQVIANADWPIQFRLETGEQQLRRSA